MTTTLLAFQKQRRDTAANWTSINPVLLAGEIGIESNTGYWKVGNGSTPWTGLAYITGTQLSAYPIVDADVNASAAIAGTKISPNFGSQNVVTTGTNTAASLIPTGSSVPTNGVYLPAANSVGISTNGTGRLFVDASGRVGINTAAPNTALHVSGGAELGAFNTTTLPASSVDGGAFFSWNRSGGSAETNICNLFDNAGLSFEFLQKTGASTASVLSRIGTSNHIFYISNTERMRLDSSGRLGLGTSSPQKQLEVNGAVRLSSDASTLLELGRFSSAYGGAAISCLDSSFLRFQFAGTDRMTLTSGGSLGIGTTSPAVPLDVVGQIRTVDSTVDLRLLPLAASSVGIIGTISNHSLSLFTNNAERARIDSSGRLGLGTSTPTNIISARGPAETTYTNNPTTIGLASTDDFAQGLGGGIRLGGKFNTAGSVADFAFLSGIKENSTDGDYAGALVLGTRPNGSGGGSMERLRITSAGNVGIGTTSPNASLEVAGSIHVSGADRSIFNRSNNALTFGTSNTERARIDSSGRLLVGTSTSRNVGSVLAATTQIQTTSATIPLSVVTNRTDGNGTVISIGSSRGATVDSTTIVQANDVLGAIRFAGADGVNLQSFGAQIGAFVDGTPGAGDMPGRLVFSVTADGASTPTEALRISNNRAITVSDGGNVVLGTTTGTKIGTATTQKLGFYNATPVVQPTAVADATDAATAISQLNALLAHMRTLGLIAT
jgi:hypothetical protein